VYQPDEFIYELWALPFSLEKQQATGKPFVIAQQAYESSVASDGTLVYLEAQGFGKGRFTWLDRKGKEYKKIELEGVSNQYGFALSPDGKLVAFLGRAHAGAELSIWLHDLLRGRSFRLTSDPGRELVPVWSPSGEYLAYSSNRTGTFHIYVRRVDGSGESTALTTAGNNVATDWSRDGKYLFYEETAADAFGDLWYLERSGDGNRWIAKPWLQTRHGERFGRFSPDGKFAAYLSNESGQEELYVRPFPAGERRWRLSTGGAWKAYWRRDGRELFYPGQGAVMALPVSTHPDFSIGTPARLFAQHGFFDVSGDGQRFLAAPDEAHAQQPVIRVVQNWHAEYRHP
jgi:Tol biopolymer transport system component